MLVNDKRSREVLHRRKACGRAAGFTLIELLVVVGILGLLMAILLPAMSKLTQKAETSTAKSEVSRIVGAWENYYREYGRWPVGPGQNLFAPVGGAHQQNAAEGGPGMQMLVGVMTNIMYPGAEFGTGGTTHYVNKHPVCVKYNAKRIQFMTYDTDVIDKATGAMVDPWGNPYWFMFDLDRDGKIERGGTMATTVYAKVIAWSLGPDGVLSSDDVKSWE